MKFTLTYDGQLPGSGNNSRKLKEKWSIREQISPQLSRLWTIHPCLKVALQNRFHPLRGSFYSRDEYHHSVAPENNEVTSIPEGSIDLCAVQRVGDINFIPLVRNTYATVCSLSILFMRQEPIGRVYQGGDLDNRIKTLLDALSVPKAEQVAQMSDPKNTAETIYCLLEDDALVAGLSVETCRLLTSPTAPENEVRLIIQVDVKVTDARSYNTLFLGD